MHLFTELFHEGLSTIVRITIPVVNIVNTVNKLKIYGQHIDCPTIFITEHYIFFGVVLFKVSHGTFGEDLYHILCHA